MSEYRLKLLGLPMMMGGMGMGSYVKCGKFAFWAAVAGAAKYLKDTRIIYKISRERIRQIESKLFKKLNVILANDYINEVEEYMKKNMNNKNFFILTLV